MGWEEDKILTLIVSDKMMKALVTMNSSVTAVTSGWTKQMGTRKAVKGYLVKRCAQT